MVVGDIGNELGIAASTLSHHLEKLKNEGLVNVRREGTYLWYSANAEALQELLGFPVCRVLHAQQSDRAAGDCAPVPLKQAKGNRWN